jgi:hypothetical protein
LFRNLQQHSRTTWKRSILFRNKRNDQYCFAKQITVIHIVPEQHGSDPHCSGINVMINIVSQNKSQWFILFQNNMAVIYIVPNMQQWFILF